MRGSEECENIGRKPVGKMGGGGRGVGILVKMGGGVGLWEQLHDGKGKWMVDKQPSSVDCTEEGRN